MTPPDDRTRTSPPVEGAEDFAPGGVTRASSPPPDASDSPDATRVRTPGEIATRADSVPTAAGAVPGYEIVRELGKGGMGAVYLARQRGLNREVAIKTILGAKVSRATLARFWAEAEVMAEVRHPNVVQVIELGEYYGRPFMAMEFVPGGSLSKRLGGGTPLPPKEAAALLEQVARGVAAAHDLGIVHRDLKPDNVLLDGDTPKVADFGIAKRKAHELTQTNDMMGTPAYMSPEQAASKAKFVGPPADVWSLGVMLYECLTATRPFDGDSVFDVLAKIATEEPPALQTLVRGVPRDVQTIVAKCLTKEPELRYPSAKELADDLGRFVRGEPIAARPVGVVERAARWVRRKPAVAAAWGGAAVTLAVSLAALAVFGLWRDAERARGQAEGANGRLVIEKQQTEEARKEAERLRDEAVALKGAAEKAQAGEEEARKEAQRQRDRLAVFEYGATIRVAHQEWRDNNLIAMRALLDGTDPKLRGWEWQYLNSLCEGSLLALKGHTDSVRAACFSPDGSRVVTGSLDRTARVWDARAGAEVLTLTGHTGGVYAACWSPDGARIVTAGADTTVRIWDARPFRDSRPLGPLPLSPVPREVKPK